MIDPLRIVQTQVIELHLFNIVFTRTFNKSSSIRQQYYHHTLCNVSTALTQQK